MVEKEERIIPAHTEEIEVKKTCDLCGKEIKPDSFKREDVDMMYSSGVSYPEDGNIEHIIYDICSACFKDVIMPFMESRGAKHRIETIEW